MTPNINFRHVGILRGGPYCGIELHGHPLPGCVTIGKGCYTSGDEYVRTPGGPIDFCEMLLSDDGEPLRFDHEREPDTEADVDDDGNRTVLVFVDYQWTHGKAD